MKKLVWLLLLSVVLSACGSSTSSVSNTASGVSVAKSVFNRTESSVLQGTASQVIKSSVSGSAIAIYNPVNGQVTIPQLQISGDTSGTTYSVEMMFQGDFLVVTSLVVVGTSTATSATALYYPFTGTVSIPYLTVTGDTSGTQYTVSLQQQGNSMNFSVANVALAPVFSSIEGTYTVTITGSEISTVTATILSDGTMTMPGPDHGKIITTKVNVSSGDFSFIVSAPDGYGVNVPMTITGHVDAATGLITGTSSMVDSKGKSWPTTITGSRSSSGGTNTGATYTPATLPTLVGNPNNGTASLSGTAIKSVNFTSDADYIYWTMELYENPNTSLSNYSGYDVGLYTVDGNAVSSRTSYFASWINMIALNVNGVWGGFSQGQGTAATVSGTTVTGRIPITNIGTGGITTVQAYVYNNGNATVGICAGSCDN